jgi:hypothetical protein
LLEVLAWIDKRHIVGPLLVRGHAAAAVVSVDVRTGARKTVGFGAHSYGEYATDLWSRPLAHRPGAPREVNPWWATFVVGSAGYFAVLIFWNLRRRRNDTA